jgi:hypothetical protein
LLPFKIIKTNLKKRITTIINIASNLNRRAFYYLILASTFFITTTTEATCQIVIKAVGDIMLGSYTPKEILSQDSGRVFCESIGAYLKDANITFGNFEGAFVPEKSKPCKCNEKARKEDKCFEFGMPMYLSPTLTCLGFNVLNLDNNHSFDFDIRGLAQTIKTLNSLKIAYSFNNNIPTFKINGKTVAIVSFGFNEYSNPITDLEFTKSLIQTLKERNDLVIVSFHGGSEGEKAMNIPFKNEVFLGGKRGDVFKFAHTAIDAGAAMVIGHGPHVLRAIELYKNKLIAYSLGNFLNYGNFNLKGSCAISVILQAELDANSGDFIKGKLISTKQIEPGIPFFDEDFKGVKLLQKLTKNDFPQTKIKILENGDIINLNRTK